MDDARGAGLLAASQATAMETVTSSRTLIDV
jgi:hypothetical protein